MHRRVVAVEVHPGDLSPVAAALDGSGPALAPLRPGGEPPAGVTVPDGVALVVTTSGSTGEPRAVLLDEAALRASAEATHDRLGGPGRWLLTLPLHHVAGLQVVVRSLLSGHDPFAVPAAGSFDAVQVAAALAALPAELRPRYGSVVPTQLHRIVECSPRDVRPWADLDAILVGGAPATPALLERARTAGLRVVTTYGSTETSGGCVYDGLPLSGTRVRTDEGGVVHLAGPTLARGYLDRPDLDAVAFVEHEGVRWFRTGDLGEVRDGVLRVHGRADDVVVTGGVKVAPAAVEAALAALPGVAQVCVVGVPDEEWGQLVVAVLVPTAAGRAPRLDEVRDVVRRTLGAAAAPRRVVLTDALPERGPGKVDRAAVAVLAATDPPRR